MPVSLTSTVDCSPKKLSEHILRLEQSARAGNVAAVEKLKDELRLAWDRESRARTRARRARESVFRDTHVYNRRDPSGIFTGWHFQDVFSVSLLDGALQNCETLEMRISHKHPPGTYQCLAEMAGLTMDTPVVRQIHDIADRLRDLWGPAYWNAVDEYRRVADFDGDIKRYKIPLNDQRLPEAHWRWFLESKPKQGERLAAIRETKEEMVGLGKQLLGPYCEVAGRLIEAAKRRKPLPKTPEDSARFTSASYDEKDGIWYCEDVSANELRIDRHNTVIEINFTTEEGASAFVRRHESRIMPRVVDETIAVDRRRAIEGILKGLGVRLG